MTEQHLAYSLVDLINILAPYVMAVLVLGGMVVGYVCHIVYEEIKYRRIKKELKSWKLSSQCHGKRMDIYKGRTRALSR